MSLRFGAHGRTLFETWIAYLERVLGWQASRRLLRGRWLRARNRISTGLTLLLLLLLLLFDLLLLQDKQRLLPLGSVVRVANRASEAALLFRLRLERLPNHRGLGILGRREYSVHRLAAGAVDPDPANPRRRNDEASKVTWQFTTADARVKLRRLYPTF